MSRTLSLTRLQEALEKITEQARIENRLPTRDVLVLALREIARAIDRGDLTYDADQLHLLANRLEVAEVRP